MSTRCPSHSKRSSPRADYHASLLATALAITAYAAVIAAIGGLRIRSGHSPLPGPAVLVALSINAWVVLLHVRLWLALPAREASAPELFGSRYDPWMGRWMLLLLAIEAVAFVDAGLWGLTPRLTHPILQVGGLIDGVAAMLLVTWADRYLIAYFKAGATGPPIEAGPYRHVRHPRYAGLFVSRAAIALLTGSPFAWLTLPGWIVIVRRRIRLEESHLIARHGEAYAAYARRVPAIWPGAGARGWP